MAAPFAEWHLDTEKEAIFRTIQAGIFIVDAKEHAIVDVNDAALKLMGRAKEGVVGQCCHAFVCPAERGKCPITDLHTTVDSSERMLLEAQGNRVPILKSVVPMVLNGRACLLECFLDLTERKRTEEKLKQAQGELLHASRLAGMAEVATSVLHNVGNVLNSVNVSVTLLSDRVRNSKIVNLSRAASLMRQQAHDLGSFMTQDPRGQQIPQYLEHLGDYLVQEQNSLLQELQSLRTNVEHIKDIVAMQQGYAQVVGVKETVRLADLVEDAVRLNGGALGRHDVEVVRDFDPSSLPEVLVEKHKVLQILVNLIGNARDACEGSGRCEQRLTVRVTSDEEGVQISVTDNGVGIPEANLTRIFNHGFTTRKNGHGFGLHSAALAAREMGGTLSARSDGLGHGATFTLRLPPQHPNARSGGPA